MTTDVYERAGLTGADIEHLSDLVAAAESADRTARYIAVSLLDVLAVVAVLDRLAAAIAPSRTSVPAVPIADEAGWLRAIGLRVRLARVARGELQADLGDRSGVSRATIGSIERADHPAAVTAYARLAVALDLPLAQLLDGSP